MHRAEIATAFHRLARIARAKAGPWKVECPVCRSRFKAFLPAGRTVRTNAMCPRCGALERHRLQWLFLRDRTDLFARRCSLLHIAPEPSLARHLVGSPDIHYITADRDPASANVYVDITELAFATDSFDVILCSHVLEHVPDDAAAMAELYRVLKPAGWAMLQVPLDETREHTFEDSTVVDPAERERLFDQADHVRVYGRDYAARLEQSGFCVFVDRFAHGLDPRIVAKHALLPEPIYVCRKGPTHA
jgi:SAM-dependent methyltransferase